jgi:uncharacterized membrane protein
MAPDATADRRGGFLPLYLLSSSGLGLVRAELFHDVRWLVLVLGLHMIAGVSLAAARVPCMKRS